MSESSIIDKVCRLCLSTTQKMMELFEENSTISKIMSCFSIKILKQEFFPSKICENCASKIDETYDFRCKVTESDALLNYFLTKGDAELQKFYLNLNGKVEIKLELDAQKNSDKLEIKIDEKIESKNGEFLNGHDQLEDGIDHLSDNESDTKLEEKVQSNENTDDTRNKDINSGVLNNYKCLTCFNVFESQNVLLNHYNQEHYQKFNNVNVEENYEVVCSDNNKMFKCKLCDKEFNRKRGVVYHISYSHTEKRPFMCRLCGRTYVTASDIVRHSRAHNGTQLFCRHKCGFSTAYHGTLRNHEKKHKKDDVKYKCEICGRGFEVKTWFDQHQNVHTGLKPFECDVCGATFHMHRYLTSHRSSAHPQASTVKRYVCVHCTLSFHSYGALRKHLKEHGIESTFLCDLCGKKLASAELLKFHKMKHLGITRYSCSTCDKSFLKSYNLKLHQRTHTGEKSYACDECGSVFGYKSALTRHILRNHSEDPTTCRKCNEQFSSFKKLTAHHKLCKSASKD